MKIASIFNQRKQFNLKSGKIDSVEDAASRKDTEHSFVDRTVSEYVQKSTIHGISYVGDVERPRFERFWWLVMLVFSIVGAICLIYQAYKTMTENPIIESPALTLAQVWDAPFPAVTFCPFSSRKFTRFGLNKTNWPEFAQNFLPDDFAEQPQFMDPSFLQGLLLQRSDQDKHDILSKVLPEIKIKDAFWERGIETETVTLQKTITSFGACLTFNMYNEKALMRDGVTLSTPGDVIAKKEPLWSRDFDFKKGLPLENYTYPFRSYDINDAFSMFFTVNQSKRIVAFDSQIMVIFHAPDEVPINTRLSNFVFIDADKRVRTEITPHLIVSEGIEKYKPSVRRCYYTAERHLKYYKLYTQNYCEWECLTNHTLAHCGCVPYALPHFNDTEICVEDLNCFYGAMRKLYIPKFIDEDNETRAPADDCDCLPTCTQLSYDVNLVKVDASTGGNAILISYKGPFFKKDVRSELHSLSEFLSISGGSLGLFLGVSIFSIVELFYFCTFRVYLQKKRGESEENYNE